MKRIKCRFGCTISKIVTSQDYEAAQNIDWDDAEREHLIDAHGIGSRKPLTPAQREWMDNMFASLDAADRERLAQEEKRSAWAGLVYAGEPEPPF